MGRYRVAPIEGLPRFYGGLVGYFGYDTVRYVEKRLAHSAPPDSLGTPDILLMVSNDVIVFDNLKGIMQIITLAEPRLARRADARDESIWARSRRRLAGPFRTFPSSSANQPVEESDFTSEFGREAFMAAIEKIREYIVAGDVMQVVLAQRMSVPFGDGADQPVPRAAQPESVAVHVLHGPRRLSPGEFVAGDPGARRRRRHREPPARRNASARPHRSRRQGDGGGTARRSRRRSPNT